MKFLTSRKIRCIINCCAPDIIERYSIPNIPETVQQVHLAIIERGPDDPTSMNSMYSALRDTIDLIDNHLASGHAVLVHCYAGRQRSPAIIIAYLIWKCNLKAIDALDIVRKFWPHTGSDYLAALERYTNLN